MARFRFMVIDVVWAIEEGRRCAAAVDPYLARTPRPSFPGEVHQFTGN